MRTPCAHCGHALWSEVRALGAFRLLAHFDDDEGSATYAEHSPSCPGCGVGLDRGMDGADESVPGIFGIRGSPGRRPRR